MSAGRSTSYLSVTFVLGAGILAAACSAPAGSSEAGAVQAAAAPQATPSGERGGQEEFGPYELVENWPQPLPDGSESPSV